jgi:hypothetical protein
LKIVEAHEEFHLRLIPATSGGGKSWWRESGGELPRETQPFRKIRFEKNAAGVKSFSRISHITLACSCSSF